MTRKRHSMATILAGALVAAVSAGQAAAQPGHETPGFHGMLVLGTERIYASHLPMFTAQHRYQGIWQVSFGEEGDQAYRDAQQQTMAESSRWRRTRASACPSLSVRADRFGPMSMSVILSARGIASCSTT